MQENPNLPDYNDFDQYIEGLLSGKKPSEKAIAKICEKVILSLYLSDSQGQRSSFRRAKYGLSHSSNDNLWLFIRTVQRFA